MEGRQGCGLWFWFEYRQPIIGWADTPPPRLQLRVVMDSRFFVGTRGLDEQFLRIGLITDVNKWFWFAANSTFYVDRNLDTLAYQFETRLEIEPHFAGRIGPMTFDDRNRLEYRHRQPIETPSRTLAGFDRFRYRNLLRINYEPAGAKWIPFVFNEWLFNLNVGFDQNRLAGGIARRLSSNVRLDGAYMWRAIRPNTTSPWSHDHLLLCYLYVGLPPKPVTH